MPINAILIILTLLLSLFIILEAVFSSTGIILNFSNYGHSMNPTIRGNALVVIDTRTPYENLKVGDVIMFKEPKGLNTATAQIHVHIEKADGDSTADPSAPGSSTSDSSSGTSADSTGQTGEVGSPGSTSSPDKTGADKTGADVTASSEGLYDLENIEYLEGHAVLHRIVRIERGGDDQVLLMTTKGDNNPYQDRYPVTEEAYLGRMMWHIDYIGDLINILYERYIVIVIATVVVTAATIALRKKYNHPVWL